jgi:hypothetical protein
MWFLFGLVVGLIGAVWLALSYRARLERDRQKGQGDNDGPGA